MMNDSIFYIIPYKPECGKKKEPTCMGSLLEAAPGFEPGVKDLQSSALPLGYAAENGLFNKT